ncbi:MAG: LysM peptidoglycan-binding domain-containing protein [Chloroflexota bacterium]|nr:LysM peptidoglycan-binding domain-containing protein [Chloroflexota bacterium]
MRLLLRAAALVALCAIALSFAPSRANAAPPADAPVSYTVQSGDTLFAIAQRYHTTVAALKQLNGLGSSDVIQVGQRLIVPSAADSNAPAASGNTSYIVQPGDTLYRIALRYGTTLRALSDLNGIPNPNLISVGEGLTIPADPSVVRPGLIVDPPVARQGGTLLIQVARPELAAVTGKFNGATIPFARAGIYFYALVGISRCAKLGNYPLALTETDDAGKVAAESATINVGATAFPIDAITLPPGKLGILEDTALVKRESDQLAAIVARYTPTRLWNGVFRQPVYTTITENFGTRRSYNGGPVSACGHEGTDFGMPTGSPIYAPARGRIVFAGLTEVRGNMTVIDHGVGVYSAYYHQSEIDVQVGQMVEPGTPLGKVGSTGLSTGPHLHWSMWANGEYVDPLEWTRRMLP